MVASKAKKKFNLPMWIFIALVLGVLAGTALQGNVAFAKTYIAWLGTLFMNLIKMLIVPLVFSSLLVGVAGLEDIKQVGRVGVKTFVYFLVTTAIAIIIGLFLANVFNVGAGFVLENADKLKYEAKAAPSAIETLVGIVPGNPLKSLVDGQMLQIIIFALFMGLGLTAVGEKGKRVVRFFDGVAEACYKITEWVMYFAPFGVFGLITPVVAVNGPKVLLPLMKLILICYAATIIHMVVTYGLSVKFLGKTDLVYFFKKAFNPWLVAFTTCSSSATLPVTMKTTEEDFKVPKSISSFVIPLGATINMDGTAIYQGVCAIFIASVYGINLTLGQQANIVMTATLASIGTAGVPGAGMIMLAMVLQGVGLPIEGIALVAGVDRILDMIRTSSNILGDITAAIYVTESEKKYGFKDVEAELETGVAKGE